MFSFKGFITKERNTHLEHLEDEIIKKTLIKDTMIKYYV